MSFPRDITKEGKMIKTTCLSWSLPPLQGLCPPSLPLYKVVVGQIHSSRMDLKEYPIVKVSQSYPGRCRPVCLPSGLLSLGQIEAHDKVVSGSLGII